MAEEAESSLVQTGGNTVAVDGFEITSSHESAEDMVKALTPSDKEAEKQPRVIRPIPDKVPDAKLSKAAAKLGAAGGKAAAEARRSAQTDGEAAEGRAASSGSDAGTAEEHGDRGEGESGSQTERPLGKPRDDPRARMLEATRKEAQAKREAAEYQRQLAERDAEIARYRQQTQEPHPSQVPTNQRERPPFKAEDFPEYDDFIVAVGQWQHEQWEQRQQQAYNEAQANYEAQAAAQQIVARIDTFHEKIQSEFGDQFTERISEDCRSLVPTFMLQEGTPIGPDNVMADEVVSSDNPTGVLLYLSEHPDVFQRIATLPSPSAIQREMAKVEARVEAATAGNPAPAKAYVPAKPPVRPVTGSPTAADPNELSDELSDDEWLRRRFAQQKASASR